MNTSALSIALTGVVPAPCDAEAGQRHREGASLHVVGQGTGAGSSTNTPSDLAMAQEQDPPAGDGFSLRTIRLAIAEICTAIRSALDDERCSAEDSLRRAAEMLHEMGEARAMSSEKVRSGLSPWQIRKVTSHIDAHLDEPIRNGDLATLVRLNPSHFGRAFRNSLGEPPHEYVIRRRIERAQGLMLSTGASLSEIALDCGLADQAHLSRLFRRVVGETPRAWRRARLGEPVECG